jgi:hypothetical protein
MSPSPVVQQPCMTLQMLLWESRRCWGHAKRILLHQKPHNESQCTGHLQTGRISITGLMPSQTCTPHACSCSGRATGSSGVDKTTGGTIPHDGGVVACNDATRGCEPSWPWTRLHPTCRPQSLGTAQHFSVPHRGRRVVQRSTASLVVIAS